MNETPTECRSPARVRSRAKIYKFKNIMKHGCECDYELGEEYELCLSRSSGLADELYTYSNSAGESVVAMESQTP